MSQIVTTSDGRFNFRRVSLGEGQTAWLWQCPTCQQWGQLSDDQWNGKVSVQCGDGVRYCGFHEIHDFGAMLVAAMQARIFMGEPPTHEDTETREQP